MVGWLYNWIERIRWDDDGRGFTVAWAHQMREAPSPFWGGSRTERVTDLAERHVSLDGVVGPATVIPGEPKAWPPLLSQTAIKSIQAMVRKRSRQTRHATIRARLPCSKKRLRSTPTSRWHIDR